MKLDKKSSTATLDNDNTSKILNQVSFFSNSHLDADEIKDTDDEDLPADFVARKEVAVESAADMTAAAGECSVTDEDQDDDHKKDCNFISELYQKFMFKSKKVPFAEAEDANLINSDDTSSDEKIVDDADEEEDEEESTYSQWSKQYHSKNEVAYENNKKNVDKHKDNNKFSKSFEVKKNCFYL